MIRSSCCGQTILLFACLQLCAQPRPWFSIPNAGCEPLLTTRLCKPACVRNRDDCPAPYTNSTICEQGQIDCGDGTCAVGPSFAEACPLNFCADLAEQENLDTDALLPCHSLRVTFNVPPGKDRAWLERTLREECGIDQFGSEVLSYENLHVQQNMLAPGFILLYVFWVLFALGSGLYSLYKRFRERVVMQSIEARGMVFGNDGDGAGLGTEMRQLGYRQDMFGTGMFFGLVLVVLSLFALLGVITLDSYDAFGRPPLFASSDYREGTFVVTWFASLGINLFIIMKDGNIRSFYRIRAPLSKCSIVTVKTRSVSNVIINQNHQTGISRLAHRIEKLYQTHIRPYTFDTLRVQRSDGWLTPYFEFKCVRYVFEARSHQFMPATRTIPYTNKDIIALKKGLSSANAMEAYEFCGPNQLSVHVPSLWVAMSNEFLATFYLYQVMCMWVWLYFDYWKMAIVIFVVVFGSTVVKVLLALKSRQQIKIMAEHDSLCHILREGNWCRMSTTQLVPGDVFQLESQTKVPCDAVIVEGDVIVDESMLTGESMPVQKFALQPDTKAYQKDGRGKKNTVFAGTQVLQVSSKDDSGRPHALAMVETTGAHTDKGRMIRNVLFPQRVAFSFNEELRVVFLVLGLWAAAASIISLFMLDAGSITTFFYMIFTISQVISPLLFAMLVIGESVSSARLKSEHQIFSLDLARISLAGKIRVFCFDKTGTLTKDGLEWEGGIPISEKGTFGDKHVLAHNLPRVFQMAIGTAHTISKLGDRLVGPPVDMEMFKASRWGIESQSGVFAGPGTASARVLRAFEFDHALMRMTVVVQDTHTREVHVFCKGSFETIKDHCNSNSIPINYDEMACYHAKSGCYTLGLAHKTLGVLPPEEVEHLTRHQIESDLNAIGLILFRNKLKDDTKPTIAEMKRGHIRTVMITGDNAFTGIHIARECGMTVSPRCPVYLGDTDDAGNLFWVNAETTQKVDIGSVRRRRFELGVSHTETKENGDGVKMQPLGNSNYELAVTGKAFDKLDELRELRDILLEIRIFARMTPEGKVRCVKLHMERAIVGMCGDGGNDCGALRVAHAGIALSEAEASIVSPFSSKTRSIRSCVDLIKEGRCSLATGLNSYRFIILYGETLVFTKIIGYYFTVVLSEMTWVFVDGFMMVLLSWALTQSKPNPKLSRFRPTARVLGSETLAVVVGILVINWTFTLGAVSWFLGDPAFRCRQFDGNLFDIEHWWFLGDNFEAEILSFMAISQLMSAAALLNVGFEFRAAWWRNWKFLSLWTLFWIVIALLLFLPPNVLGCLFRYNCGTKEALSGLGFRNTAYLDEYLVPWGHNVLASGHRITLFLIMLGNFAAIWLFMSFGVVGPLRHTLRKKRPQVRLRLAH